MSQSHVVRDTMSCGFLFAYVIWELKNWLLTFDITCGVIKLLYVYVSDLCFSHVFSTQLWMLSYDGLMAFEHHKEGQIWFPEGQSL